MSESDAKLSTSVAAQVKEDTNRLPVYYVYFGICVCAYIIYNTYFDRIAALDKRVGFQICDVSK